jgi:hypothetical protein
MKSALINEIKSLELKLHMLKGMVLSWQVKNAGSMLREAHEGHGTRPNRPVL